MTPQPNADDVGHLLRELAPQVLGAVARRHDDFASAEDAVQEAMIAAAEQWPVDGIPDNPKGWLFRVAIRRLTDQMRSELARHRREEHVATLLVADAVLTPPADPEMGPDRDDSLTLLFMCCHPALTPPSAIALTLRAVGGLTTAEIANAFLVPEATMAQRISRAKQSIRTSKVPFSLPDESERAERLRSVLHVLYLIFNEGYASSTGTDLQRTDLAREAIRLVRMLHMAIPNDAEAAGLLALMLLTDARRDARTGPEGELIPLDEQDRALWNRDQIEEGIELLARTMAGGTIGYYQLQAAIAATHDQASSVENTDWAQIHALYGLLEQMSDNPMVRLNRAIAAGMVYGPSTGLELIDALEGDPRLTGHYRLDAVRGHLFERSGEAERAVHHFRRAAERTMSIPERNYLIAKAAQLARGNSP